MASLYKRGNVHYSKIRIGGREIRKPLSTNERIAEEMLGELVKERNAARYGQSHSDMAWAEFRRRILEQSKEDNKKNTWLSNVRAFREMERVSPIQRLNQCSPELLDNLKSAWIKAGRGKYVINRDLRAIRTAMRKAEAWGYIRKQDWTTNKYIKTPKGRLHFFAIEDMPKLKNVCLGVWRTVYYLGARAGLRREEIRTLPWKEVDFKNNRIHIAPTDEWTPKDYERRWIPMPKDLAEYLRGVKNGSPYVFSDDGERPSLGSMTTYFKRLVKKAGLKGSLHTLRHTYGSHYIQNGGNIYKLKEYMGHSSIETTQIYAHLAPDHADETIDNLPQI